MGPSWGIDNWASQHLTHLQLADECCLSGAKEEQLLFIETGSYASSMLVTFVNIFVIYSHNNPAIIIIVALLQMRKLRLWKVKVKLLSRVRPSATPWTAVYQAPLSMGFSRQEYWSGLPLPSLISYPRLLKCWWAAESPHLAKTRLLIQVRVWASAFLTGSQMLLIERILEPRWVARG